MRTALGQSMAALIERSWAQNPEGKTLPPLRSCLSMFLRVASRPRRRQVLFSTRLLHAFWTPQSGRALKRRGRY